MEEDKDQRIEELSQKLEEAEQKLTEANRKVDSLIAELCREKLINDKLLQLGEKAPPSTPVAVQQQQSQLLSPASQLLTPGQGHLDQSDANSTDGGDVGSNINASNININSSLGELQENHSSGYSHDAPPDDFEGTVVQSEHELRRIKRARGMMFGMRHIPNTVDTLIITDSNGRDIKGSDIDGSGSQVCFRSIGGLCIPAITEALKTYHGRMKRTLLQIKHLSFALGTNDQLHKREHPEDVSVYIKQLDGIARKTFPNARISFSLPFSGIKCIGADYIAHLRSSIRSSSVGWQILTPPTMVNKLVGPQEIHLNHAGRFAYKKWLRKVYCPIDRQPTDVVGGTQRSQEQQPTTVVTNSDDKPRAPRQRYSDAAQQQNQQLQPPINSSSSHMVGEDIQLDAPINSMLKQMLFLLQQMDRQQPGRGIPPPWHHYC